MHKDQHTKDNKPGKQTQTGETTQTRSAVYIYSENIPTINTNRQTQTQTQTEH